MDSKVSPYLKIVSNTKIIHNNAIYQGYTDLFKWLVPTAEIKSTTDGLYSINASLHGHLEILKYLCSNGCPLVEPAYYCAAQKGNLKVLEYLHKNNCPRSYEMDIQVCAITSKNGHLEVLKYLFENGWSWDYSVCRMAVSYGRLEIVKYLQTKLDRNDFTWNWLKCRDAVGNGQLEVLKYLLEIGCVLDENVCNSAVVSGQLEILKYLRELGCSR